MMDDAVAQANLPVYGATNLNGDTAFDNIKCDDEDTQWNNVYCPSARINLRAGESVELEPPVRITGTNYFSTVAAIPRVDQSTPQRVLLSLFLPVVTGEMLGIQHEPPMYRDYVQYP
jgi:hypothetical protein